MPSYEIPEKVAPKAAPAMPMHKEPDADDMGGGHHGPHTTTIHHMKDGSHHVVTKHHSGETQEQNFAHGQHEQMGKHVAGIGAQHQPHGGSVKPGSAGTMGGGDIAG